MAWKQAAALGGSVQFDITPSADALDSTRQILRASRGASPIPPERRIAWVTFQGGVFRERHARVCNDLEAGIVLILNDVTLIDRTPLTVIPRLRQLVIRSVARQQLIGDFPVLPSLHGITLDNVTIDAGALNRLADLPELKQLMLAHCETDDLHAVHFDRLHALRDLRIWLVNGQRLTLPPAVTESVGLEFLELSGFELSNDCVARIGQLPGLRTLGLASTMLPDNTLELLRDSSVTHLTVDDGQFTPQQAADFERHTKGRVVEVIRPEPHRADIGAGRPERR